MDFNDEEEKIKFKMYIIITLLVIGAFILFILLSVFSMKSFIDDFDKHKYYVVEVNDNNRNEIINLLDAEELDYCELMYKIEYEIIFTGDIFSKVYCQNEDDIILNIYDYKNKLIQYIQENGIVEKR